MQKKSLAQNGFTLIELLVVVAIIGILSSLLMANFVGIRQRARDAQRKADLRQIQSAFELYRADTGGYPTGGFISETGNSVVCNNPLQSTQGTIYMKNLPCDPLTPAGGGVGTQIYYEYDGDSTKYCLRACLENTTDAQRDSLNDDNTSQGGYNVAGCALPANLCKNKSAVSYTLQNP